MQSHIPHIPVLKNEVLQVFQDIKEGILIDCTTGFGGHSEALLESHANLKIIGIDRDEEARAFALERLKRFGDRFVCRAGSFAEIFPTLLKENHRICGVLADIGVSSYQLDMSHRGFGFESEVLDMRMDRSGSLTAKKILENYSQKDLEDIFYHYGELRESKKLASLIVNLRNKDTSFMDTARNFSHWLRGNFKNPKILPLVYQALRIEVNSELDQLKILLESAKDLSDATLCVITFHSLEDRMVKTYFRDYARSCICPENTLKCECGNHHQLGKILNKKPMVAQNLEIKNNSRAKSAKLRAFKFD